MPLQAEVRLTETEDEVPLLRYLWHPPLADSCAGAPAAGAPAAGTPAAASPTLASAGAIDITSLATQHGRRLYQFIARRIDNPSDAQDLVQITYIEAWLHADRFRGDSLPQTWLFGIALNVVRNFKTRSSTYRFVFEDIDAGLYDQVEEHDPYWHHALRQRYQGVMQQLENATPAMQALAELVFIDQLSYAEAAQRLAVPVGTVRSRLARLRERLIAADGSTHGS